MTEKHQPHRRSPGESYPGPQPDEPERDPYEHRGPSEEDAQDEDDDG